MSSEHPAAFTGVFTLLLIEADPASARRLRKLAGAANPRWSLECVADLPEAFARLNRGGVHAVLLSLPTRGGRGAEAVVELCSHAPETPVVVALIDGRQGELAAALRHDGGPEYCDYLLKDELTPEALSRTVHSALERAQLAARLEQSARQLQATEANFQNVIESNADGMVVVDQAGAIVFVNPAATFLLGRSAQELLGSRFEFPLAVGQPTELSIVRSEGHSVRSVEMRVVETVWEGAPARLASLRDITERKQLDRMKDEFVSTVSHELRTPLTSIKGAVTLMFQRKLGDISAEQEDFLRTISGDIDRLAELINNLLDLSKVGAGKLVLARQRVDLADLIEQVCRSHQAIIGRRQILRRLPEVPCVYADAGRIFQVLANLLSNAIKFTQEDGTIAFELEARPGGVAVTVRDNGPGIPKEDQWRLFQKFEQVRRSWSERPKGTGLGLAICREIIDLHGGAITVDSEPGHGTAFVFTLPLYDPTTAFAKLFEDIKAAAASERHEFGLILIDGSDLRDRAKRLAGTSAQWVLNECADAIRHNISKHDRVMALDEARLVVFAVADEAGLAVIRRRLEELLATWLPTAFGSAEPLRFLFATARVPHDAREPAAVLACAQARLAPAGPAAPPAGATARPPQPAEGQRRVLVVDDEPSIRKIVCKQLQVAGYDVLVAADGQEGLAMAREGHPDLIVLDVMLPKMNGHEVCAALRQDPGFTGVPILMLTAKSQRKDKEEGLQHGADAYLTKPFQLEELLQRLQALQQRANGGS
jgi:signal transduction histidine kinase/ActR/RegA family two-component response regulator